VKGDSRSQSIAAASIIAKETRDRWMIENDCWPDYGFSSHKGYATPWHLKIISEKGPCPIHRLSYAPFQPDLFL
jgi:ribonuclease HII